MKSRGLSRFACAEYLIHSYRKKVHGIWRLVASGALLRKEICDFLIGCLKKVRDVRWQETVVAQSVTSIHNNSF